MQKNASIFTIRLGKKPYLCTMKKIFTLFVLGLSLTANAQQDSIKESKLDEVIVTSQSGIRRIGGALNGVNLGQKELFRMACCNLGESFATNPSVDVNYSDAATGAKQIKLLGLSGTYVQMLTNSLPDFRGVASPFALGFVPGTWMKSINISKGAASVKQGYESITGQIDVEYLKTDDEPSTGVNLYGDSQARMEANFDTNLTLGKGWSTNILAHYENRYGHHDQNDDGFQDMPKVEQGNLMNHWKYLGAHYIMHAGWSILKEERNSGQNHHVSTSNSSLPIKGEGGGEGLLPLYKIGIDNNRYAAYMKHAFVLNPEKQMNIALMANASMHETKARYGNKELYINQKNLFAQLMYEAQFTEEHNLSTGVSIVHDYDQLSKENTLGAYAQYTYSIGTKLVAMAGLRWDHSSLWGNFITPRAHIKWQPADVFSIRLSAGRGYRTPHALTENHNLLASGRTLIIDNTTQEKADNYGISTAFNIPIGEKTLKLNAEYYYTHFSNQMVIDYEMNSADIIMHDLQGRSFSHVLQVDATYPLFKGFTLTAAYRLNDVKCTYAGELREKPLTSRYKGLITAQYKDPLELWQFDITLQLNGGGRVVGDERFKAYEQLSAQITREFRHFSIYVGGENLTGFKQKNPIRHAEHPWSTDFEPTLIWGPIDGAMAYAGIRIRLKH